MPKYMLLVAATAASLVFVACGSSSSTETQTIVTVIKEVQAPTEDVPTEDVSDGANDEEAEPASMKITVPDVVGMNHQAAQDKMQSVGLYNLDEEDATGEGRMLMWDRNWEVVTQTPSGGEKVDEDTTILLSSKKIGE